MSNADQRMTKWGKLVFKVSMLPSLISCFLSLASGATWYIVLRTWYNLAT